MQVHAAEGGDFEEVRPPWAADRRYYPVKILLLRQDYPAQFNHIANAFSK